MDKEFLEEIKLQFQLVNDSIDNIKRRTTHMISFVGIIITAATGLGLDSAWDAELGSFEWGVGIALMITGIGILGFALHGYYKIIKTRSTLVPIVSKKMLCECDSEVELSDAYKKWADADAEIYYQEMSKVYLRCIKGTEEINDDIADRFNGSTRKFMIGAFVYAVWAILGTLLA